MDLANAPWKSSYPAGLSPDVKLGAFAVHEIVERAAAEFGDRSCLKFRGRGMSFRELKQEVDRAASAFLAAGIGKGDRIALLLPNTIWHPVAFFGALKAGAAVVHLSPLDSPRILAHKLSDSGARVLVTTNIGEMALSAARLVETRAIDLLIVGEDEIFGASPLTGPTPKGAHIRSFSKMLAEPASHAAAFPEVGVDDLALLQYTGGTTGLPKGAMLTHRNISASIESYDRWSHATGAMRRGQERVLLFLPLFHIYGLSTVMLRCVLNGHELLLHTRFDPEIALAEIEAGVTILPGVPTMWIAIASTPGFEARDYSSLHHCGSGGAPLPVEIARKLKLATGHDLLGGWGMTETSPAGTNIPLTRSDKVATIGIPLPGIWLDVVSLDDPSRVLPQGETGELRIFGPNVTAGYLNRPEETAAAFCDGGFLTGDIGFMDEEGFFTIVDRKKDMIICGGFNVYPQMIEQAIYEHPDVEEALVIGIADAYRGEAPKAFVKLHDGSAELTLEALRAFLKSQLGPHELPSALEIRPALPRTPVGKLSKLELKQEERARLAASELQGELHG
jgi:long-chain acyl-CoA synthetase